MIKHAVMGWVLSAEECLEVWGLRAATRNKSDAILQLPQVLLLFLRPVFSVKISVGRCLGEFEGALSFASEARLDPSEQTSFSVGAGENLWMPGD